jgi:hypothetical protein
VLSHTHKYVFGLGIFIVYSVILDKYIHFLLNIELLAIPIQAAEWALLFILIGYFLSRKNGMTPKILILVFVVKIGLLAVVFHELSFQKNLLVLIALTTYTFQCKQFRVYCIEGMRKHYWTLLLLLLVSFLPFAPFYNRYFAEVDASGFSEVRRFGGLWELPHVYAYLILAMIVMRRKENYMLNIFLLLNIIATGVRSAMLAAFVYYAHMIVTRLKNLRHLYAQAVLVAGLMLLLFITTDVGAFVKDQYEFHIGPLLEEDPSTPTYGKGRFIFNFIALQDMQAFNTLELLVGRSATALYNSFENFLGMKSWPHNDYVTVTYIYGLIGLVVYLYAIHILPLKSVRFQFQSKVFAIDIVTFVLALTNGYYTYHSFYLFTAAYAIHAEGDIAVVHHEVEVYS